MLIDFLVSASFVVGALVIFGISCALALLLVAFVFIVAADLVTFYAQNLYLSVRDRLRNVKMKSPIVV